MAARERRQYEPNTDASNSGSAARLSILYHHLGLPHYPPPLRHTTTMATQFDHIYHGLSPELGSAFITYLEISMNRCSSRSYLLIAVEFRVAPSGMAWKGSDAGSEVVAVPSTDIKWAQWLRLARQFQLRVGLRDHRKEKFDGFAREVRAQGMGESLEKLIGCTGS